jgi:cell division protein FtsW
MVPARVDDDDALRPAPALSVQAPAIEAGGRSLDLILLSAVLGLVVLGTIEVYSSSAVYAFKKTGDAAYFLERQLMYLGLGLGALWTGAALDHRLLRRFAYPLLLLAFALLVGVLAAGATVNAARRWFIIGPLSFQPVELAKLALIVYLATSLSRKAEKVKLFSVGFVPHLLVCGLMMGLLLKQPDLGSSIILGATTLTLLFAAGTKVSYILLAVLGALPVAYHLVVGTPWRMQRFMAYFNPDAFADTVAYQIVQSRIAIGSGGWTGAGLGEGRQQLGYMPEGHSDFIMSAVGEELGFVGVLLVIALFVVILWRGIVAATRSREPFGGYLAFGITICFAYQVLVNLGVVLGVLPAKGLTLPFVSYGGTSLIMSMFLAGIVLNVASGDPARAARRRELVNSAGARKRRRRAVVLVG